MGTKRGITPNRFESVGEAIAIWLNFKGREMPCFIDAADYPLVKGYRWHATRTNTIREGFYARTSSRGSLQIFMHEFIFGEKKPDHVDRDGLNNRRENLRAASSSESACNQGLRVDNTTGFKGVVLGYKNKFLSRISIKGETHHLGTFNNAIDAAKAYNKAAKELHGEFAVLNDVGGTK
jgi:hypothetical protein